MFIIKQLQGLVLMLAQIIKLYLFLDIALTIIFERQDRYKYWF